MVKPQPARGPCRLLPQPGLTPPAWAGHPPCASARPSGSTQGASSGLPSEAPCRPGRGAASRSRLPICRCNQQACASGLVLCVLLHLMVSGTPPPVPIETPSPGGCFFPPWAKHLGKRAACGPRRHLRERQSGWPPGQVTMLEGPGTGWAKATGPRSEQMPAWGLALRSFQPS